MTTYFGHTFATYLRCICCCYKTVAKSLKMRYIYLQLETVVAGIVTKFMFSSSALLTSNWHTRGLNLLLGLI